MRPNYPHMLFSLSKSFTSTAVGLAVAEGRLSVDDPVLSFFPEDAPAEVEREPGGDARAPSAVHVHRACGGYHGPLFTSADGNWVKAFLALPVEHEPGTHFLYNSGATYMLSAIVQKGDRADAAGLPAAAPVRAAGHRRRRRGKPARGASTWAAWGLSVKTEDIARFGQLYLQKGMWQGQRILPEAWVAEATSRQVSNGANPESDWEQGYGYQFWRCRHEIYRGDGAFGQYCIVMPEQDAVLAITSGCGRYAGGAEPGLGAPASGDGRRATAREPRRSRVSWPASWPACPCLWRTDSDRPPLAAQVSGKTYAIEANDQRDRGDLFGLERRRMPPDDSR